MKPKDQRWPTRLFIILIGGITIYFLSYFGQSQAISDPSILLAAPHAVTLQYFLVILSMVLLTLLAKSWFQDKDTSKWDQKLLLLGWIGMSVYYILAFQPLLSPNGDNAEYIINAKALVEHGRALRLDTPNDTPNTLASLGLPTLLSPVYAIWGMDIYKMKAMIMLLGLMVFPVLYYFLKDQFGSIPSLMITLVGFTSPYVLGSSTTIMTETPYILFSILGLIVCHRYHQSKSFSWKWGLLSLLMLVVVFQMRIVGLALAGALGAVLSISTIKEYLNHRAQKSKQVNFLKGSAVKKLLLIMVPALAGVIVLQIWQGNTGTSQAEVFFGTDILNNAWHKLSSCYMLIGPMLFSSETFHWISFAVGAQPPVLNMGWFLVAIPAGVGLAHCLYKNQIAGYYALFCSFLIVFGSRAAEEMVIMRYLTILVPLLIYFYVVGVQWLIDRSAPKLALKRLPILPKIVCGLLLAQMLLSNAGSNAFSIARGQIGYGTRYEDMISTAEWAGKYLPRDAYVASVKPRIFYLYSNLDGVRLLNSSHRSGQMNAQDIIKYWFDLGITHLMIDQLSGSSRSIAAPVVESAPHLFEKIASPSANGSTTIYKLRPDSES